MKDSQDFNHVTVDAINESIVVIEEFPDRLVFSFRHHASESGKVCQLFNSKGLFVRRSYQHKVPSL